MDSPGEAKKQSFMAVNQQGSLKKNHLTDIPRCTRCILPEEYPGNMLESDGVCRLCKTYKRPKVKGFEALHKRLERKRGKEYDCLVPISGGRDSTYVLYFIAQKTGLRTLAVNYNNGFRHPVAAANLKAASRILGTNLQELKSREGLNARYTRSVMNALVPKGPGETVKHLCRHCYGSLAHIYSLAERQGIPFIVWGDSREEKLSYSKEKAANQSRGVHHLMSPSYLNALRLLMLQRLESLPSGNFPFTHKQAKLKSRNIEEIHLFDYIEWDRREIKRVIEGLGWRKPDDSLSTWRIDCTLHQVVNYCTKKAVGYTHDFDGLANMVRAGKMERCEAIKLLSLGFDDAKWDQKIEMLLRNVIKLPDSRIAAMQDW